MALTCKACGASKSADEFYPSNKSKCKECVKAVVRANRAAKVDYYRAYDRARADLPERVAARAAYQQTDAFRASHDAAVKRWKDNHQQRRRAQTAVGNAIRDGRLTPWPACALPECDAKPEAHHPDYDRPLQVEWLCPAHHKQAHALFRRLVREAP